MNYKDVKRTIKELIWKDQQIKQLLQQYITNKHQYHEIEKIVDENFKSGLANLLRHWFDVDLDYYSYFSQDKTEEGE